MLDDTLTSSEGNELHASDLYSANLVLSDLEADGETTSKLMNAAANMSQGVLINLPRISSSNTGPTK